MQKQLRVLFISLFATPFKNTFCSICTAMQFRSNSKQQIPLVIYSVVKCILKGRQCIEYCWRKSLALLISYFCLVINHFRCRLESSLLERKTGIELYIFLMTFLITLLQQRPLHSCCLNVDCKVSRDVWMLCIYIEILAYNMTISLFCRTIL